MASENNSRYYIPYNSTNLSNKYTITKEEETFFDKLLENSVHLKGEFQFSEQIIELKQPESKWYKHRKSQKATKSE